VRIERTDLLSSDAEENKSDIIAANITADILIRLADVIDKYLKNGGIAIISGVIKERKKQVNECYIKKGFKLLTEIETGDWCAIKFVFDPY
jgi:ribosomal protein L11 methyltransferase